MLLPCILCMPWLWIVYCLTIDVVKSYGTENRPGPNGQVPPSDHVFEVSFIVICNSNILNNIMCIATCKLYYLLLLITIIGTRSILCFVEVILKICM